MGTFGSSTATFGTGASTATFGSGNVAGTFGTAGGLVAAPTFGTGLLNSTTADVSSLGSSLNTSLNISGLGATKKVSPPAAEEEHGIDMTEAEIKDAVR